MKKILVTYATMAGSTAEVAQAIAKEISSGGSQVEVLPINQVSGLESYDFVVVGGPMIMGWHRTALSFLKKNRSKLRNIPLAIFVLAMSLTQTGETGIEDIEVYIDETLPKPPVNAGHLTFRERYARLTNYLQPIIGSIRPAKPVSIGVFNGRMEYGRLKWWAVLFAMLIIRAPAGDRRNWQAIEGWARRLSLAANGERKAN